MKVLSVQDGSLVEKTGALAPVKSVSTQNQTTTVNYNFREFVCSESLFTPNTYTLSAQNFGINELSGEPAIPIGTDLFVIPDGYEAQLEIVNYTFKEYDMNIAPAHMPEPDNSAGSMQTIDVITPYFGLFPKLPVALSAEEMTKDCKIQYVSVYPIQYNLEQGKVRVAEKLTYKIYFRPSKSSIAATKRIARRSNNRILKNLVLNPQLMNSNDNSDNGKVASKYLFITVPELLDEVNNFASWKKSFGFDVHVISENNWTSTKVKQRIQQYYNSNDIEYLLLIGDVDQIPFYEKGIDLWSVEGRPDYDYYISDYGYSCLDNDALGDICIGRIPASLPSQAKIMFEKIIHYEKNPCTIEKFYKKAVHASYFQVESANIKDKETRGFIKCSETIRNMMVDIGMNINRIYNADASIDPVYMKDSTLIPTDLRRPHYTWNGNRNDIINAVDSGCVYIFHRDHGGVSSWGRPNFQLADINSLRNGKLLPFVFSINCLTGRFDADDCFSEHWIKKEDGGACAVLCAGGKSPTTTNDVFAEEMFRILKDNQSLSSKNEISLGYLLMSSINALHLRAGWNIYTNYERKIYHWLGDPSMNIRLYKPSDIDSISIDITNSPHIYVSDPQLDVVLYNKSKETVEILNGNRISLDKYMNSNFTICIKGVDVRPAYVEISKNGTLSIQDETIGANRHYKAKNIKLGNSVIGELPKGKTVIRGGKIQFEGCTSMEAGTEVEEEVVLDILP